METTQNNTHNAPNNTLNVAVKKRVRNTQTIKEYRIKDVKIMKNICLYIKK